MKRKLLALTLCILMLTALLPVTARAASEDEKTQLNSSKGDIIIGANSVSGYDSNGQAVTTHDPDGYVIIGNGSGRTVTVSGGVHDITLSNVTIHSSAPFVINSGATVYLTINGKNLLVNTDSGAGLQVPNGASLTIVGTGSLESRGRRGGAGIGGAGGSAGTITINSGTIIAYSDLYSAGIGGSTSCDGGTVTINGGNIRSTGGAGGAAGIGGGNAGAGGTVTITGGTVTAICPGSGAGIGGGYRGNGGTVIITGGNVRATGATSIGGGPNSSNNGTLTNGSVPVYCTALTLTGIEADTPISSWSVQGLSTAYGMHDVTSFENQFYFYLPKDTTVNSVTIDGRPSRLFTGQSGKEIKVAADHNNSYTLTAPTASIADVTVSGEPDRALVPTTATITLDKAWFVQIPADTDISHWFTNRPQGLVAKVSSAVEENADSLTVSFSGTPAMIHTEAITMLIPGHMIKDNVWLTTNANANAKWDIAAPTVTAVAVNPASVNIMKGGTQTFSATVRGTHNPAQKVIWYVEGGAEGTVIDAAGVLTVSADETATALTIFAIATADPHYVSTATIRLTEPVGYQVTQGADGVWTRGGTNDLGFTADGDYENFTGVSVDGEELSTDNYTAVSGSTVVTLKAAYLETLTAGQHTLRIVYTDGFAETHFTVNAAVPHTGDSANPALWLAIALAAFAAVLTFLSCERKVRPKKANLSC